MHAPVTTLLSLLTLALTALGSAGELHITPRSPLLALGPREDSGPVCANSEDIVCSDNNGDCCKYGTMCTNNQSAGLGSPVCSSRCGSDEISCGNRCCPGGTVCVENGKKPCTVPSNGIFDSPSSSSYTARPSFSSRASDIAVSSTVSTGSATSTSSTPASTAPPTSSTGGAMAASVNSIGLGVAGFGALVGMLAV